MSILSKQAAFKLGMEAEVAAALFLESSCRMNVLGIRVRTAGGEIDIVAQDGEHLVVVEVKARATQEEGLYSITPAKQKRLVRAAEALLMEAEKIAGLQNAQSLNIRFDAVIISPQNPPLHLPNAWQVE